MGSRWVLYPKATLPKQQTLANGGAHIPEEKHCGSQKFLS
jgi:hypothetical protein